MQFNGAMKTSKSIFENLVLFRIFVKGSYKGCSEINVKIPYSPLIISSIIYSRNVELVRSEFGKNQS